MLEEPDPELICLCSANKNKNDGFCALISRSVMHLSKAYFFPDTVNESCVERNDCNEELRGCGEI